VVLDQIAGSLAYVDTLATRADARVPPLGDEAVRLPERCGVRAFPIPSLGIKACPERATAATTAD
jgi:hypothetical protein